METNNGNMEKQYQILSDSSVTQEGDEYFSPNSKRWEKVIVVGETCERINPFLVFRRLIK